MAKETTVQYYGTGRRKDSVARVYLRPGKGEILVKTPYLQECSENKLFKGWFKTGDIGKIHSDGSLSILGRKKDIIIKDGKNNVNNKISINLCFLLLYWSIYKY